MWITCNNQQYYTRVIIIISLFQGLYQRPFTYIQTDYPTRLLQQCDFLIHTKIQKIHVLQNSPKKVQNAGMSESAKMSSCVINKKGREKQEIVLKFVMLGTGKTGKTYFLNKLKQQQYNQYIATIRSDFQTKQINVCQLYKNQNTMIWIWDNGQDILTLNLSAILLGSTGIFLFCNTNDKSSFDQCGIYLKQIRDSCRKDVIIMLIGNTYSNERIVQTDELVQFSQHHNILYTEINEELNSTDCYSILHKIASFVVIQIMEKGIQIQKQQHIQIK
ncbi:Rab1a [Hexamita inflata]|uniref:Rab1a n=1 Tax=Hexamita inflata TaxID=28002 RepID=A0AA86QLY9_9EUKA|nr:Rab1a [Hexamita inflata]